MDGRHHLAGIRLGEAGRARDWHEPLVVGVGVGVEDGLAGGGEGGVARGGGGLGLEGVHHVQQRHVDGRALLVLALGRGGGYEGVDVRGDGGLLLDLLRLLVADALDLREARGDLGLLARLVGHRRGTAAGLLSGVSGGSRGRRQRDEGSGVVLLHHARLLLHVHGGHDDGVAGGCGGEDGAGGEGGEVLGADLLHVGGELAELSLLVLLDVDGRALAVHLVARGVVRGQLDGVLCDQCGGVNGTRGRDRLAVQVVSAELVEGGAHREVVVRAVPAAVEAALADGDGPVGERARARGDDAVVAGAEDALGGHLAAGVAGVETADGLPHHELLLALGLAEEGEGVLVGASAELVGGAVPRAEPQGEVGAAVVREAAVAAALEDHGHLLVRRAGEHADDLVDLGLGDEGARGEPGVELLEVLRLGLVGEAVREGAAGARALGAVHVELLGEPLPAHHARCAGGGLSLADAADAARRHSTRGAGSGGAVSEVLLRELVEVHARAVHGARLSLEGRGAGGAVRAVVVVRTVARRRGAADVRGELTATGDDAGGEQVVGAHQRGLGSRRVGDEAAAGEALRVGHDLEALRRDGPGHRDDRPHLLALKLDLPARERAELVGSEDQRGGGGRNGVGSARAGSGASVIATARGAGGGAGAGGQAGVLTGANRCSAIAAVGGVVLGGGAGAGGQTGVLTGANTCMAVGAHGVVVRQNGGGGMAGRSGTAPTHHRRGWHDAGRTTPAKRHVTTTGLSDSRLYVLRGRRGAAWWRVARMNIHDIACSAHTRPSMLGTSRP